MDRTQRAGMLYVGLAVTGYSFLPILSKEILASGLSPMDVALWRFIFAAPTIWLFITLRRLPKPSRPLPRPRLLGLGILLSLSAIDVFFGLQYLPASTYVVLFYTYPTIVALLSALMGERLPPVGWVALAMTLTGVALTVPDFTSGLGGGNLLGVALALGNAFIVSVYFIVNSRLLQGHTAMARASAWAITGALIVMLLLAPLRQAAAPSDLKIWIYLVLLAVFCTAMPVFALFTGIHKLGPARAAIMGTIEPILTLTWATLLLGETRQPLELLGGAFVIASVVLLQTRGRVRARALEVPSTVSSG